MQPRALLARRTIRRPESLPASAAVAALLWLSLPAARAQSPPSARFEVVSIKPCKSDPGSGGGGGKRGGTGFPGTSIALLCRNLSSLFDRDVIDRTGLDGLYDIRVDAVRVVIPVDSAAAAAPPDPDAPPPRPQLDPLATARAFQSAFSKLGLKLQPAKGAGVFLVVDRIERPTAN